MPDEMKQQSPKWSQAKRTVDWLSTQLPANAQFQIFGFNEKAFAARIAVYLSGSDRASISSGTAVTAFISPNAARNIGLARVKTPYLAFVDNDVRFRKGWTVGPGPPILGPR